MRAEVLEKIKQLKDIYTAQAEPVLLKDKVLWAYARKTLDRLSQIVLQDEGVTEALELFLKENWDLVNGTLLSPTASPRGDLTLLLKDVAQHVADTTGKTPIQILMPTVYTESFNPEEYPNLDSLDGVLETHCLERGGLYLIPVKLLLKLELTTEKDRRIPNNYADTSSIDPAIYFIQPEAYARLVDHSPLTRAMIDAKKAYDALSSDQSNLLGQLTELCRHLYINSVSARGEETNAGVGAYPAIIRFSAYYDTLGEAEKAQISAPLKAGIEKLLNLSSNKEANKDATANAETCIASLRSELVAAMKGQETVLSGIATTGEHKGHFMEAATLQFEDAKRALAEALTGGTYNKGKDDLGLTKTLLDALEIHPTVTSLADLGMVKSLSADEIRAICVDETLQEQIVTQLANIENLVIFIMELAPDKLPAFLEVMKSKLVRDFVKTPDDLAALLISLDIEKCDKVCEVSEFIGLLRPDNVSSVMESLTPEQRPVIFNALKADTSFMLEMVEQNGMTLQFIPTTFEGYQTIAMAAIKQNIRALMYAPTTLEGYQEIATAAIINNSQALEYVSITLLGYFEMALDAVKTDGKALQYVKPTAERYIEIVFEAVKQDGNALQYVPQTIERYVDVALEAVKQNGKAFRHLPAALKENFQLALEAVKQDGKAIAYVPRHVEGFHELAIAALKQNGLAMSSLRWPIGREYTLEKYQELVTAALKQNGLAVQFVPLSLKGIPAIAIMAIEQNASAFTFLPKTLQSNTDFILDAVKYNPEVLKNIPSELKENPAFMSDAVKVNTAAFEYLPDELKESKVFNDMLGQKTGDESDASRHYKKEMMALKSSHLTESQLERIKARIDNFLK